MDASLPDGLKFKQKEAEASRTLPWKTRAVIRFDGKSFSSYTKRYKKPYDEAFMGFMDETAKKACETISGAHFAYVQSDEISVVFSDLPPQDSKKSSREMWFAGKADKILSVGAATVSTYFAYLNGFDGTGAMPVFDARLHLLNSPEEVEEYVRWRRFDAQKNSVTMAAHSLYSSRELEGKSSKQRLRMLEGTTLERLPEGFYNGRIVHRVAHAETVHTPVGLVEAVRHRWESEPATRSFMENEFLSLNR